MSVLLLSIACGAADRQSDDAAELIRMHAQVLAAHRTGDVEQWLRLESTDYVSANGGRVTTPTLADRRAARTEYLRSARFTSYEDARTPIVRISSDGTLGWLIAEVRVRGHLVGEQGEESLDADWVWIELYEKVDGRWKLTGNVSNRRP